ncbi:MAG: polysaccharide biosynthesis/export family protein [Candidatus Acidiferrum sp.]
MNSKSSDWLLRAIILCCCILFFGLRCWAQPQQGNLKPVAGPVHNAARNDANVTISASNGKPHDEAFVIGSDDILSVDVWKEAEISRTVTVRSDGKITLPLVGELQASAKTPKQLEDEIISKLSGYISDPAVTVIVQEIRSKRFNILGQVVHPGSYVISSSTTVLDAIALGGGYRDFAKQKSIYILRRNPDGTEKRLLCNYKEVIKGRHPEQNIKLEPGDTVVVP